MYGICSCSFLDLDARSQLGRKRKTVQLWIISASKQIINAKLATTVGQLFFTRPWLWTHFCGSTHLFLFMRVKQGWWSNGPQWTRMPVGVDIRSLCLRFPHELSAFTGKVSGDANSGNDRVECHEQQESLPNVTAVPGRRGSRSHIPCLPKDTQASRGSCHVYVWAVCLPCVCVCRVCVCV